MGLKACEPKRLRRGGCARKREGGAIAIMAALSLTMLLGFAALAIDVANLYVVRNELQNAADAAALAGVPCVYPRSGCLNTKVKAPDWGTAQQKATASISMNSSSKSNLADGVVEYGYWNITRSPVGLQSPATKPGANDYPAIKVTISKAAGVNGGPVLTYFARIFGVNSASVGATAVAVVSSPGYVGKGGLFPVALNSCLFAKATGYWDTTTGTAINDPATKAPYIFQIQSTYKSTDPCHAGQWTSFNTDANDVPTIRGFIANGNDAQLGDGNVTWIQPGVKDSLFDDPSGQHPSVNGCSAAGNKSCEYVIVPVVDNIDTHAKVPVVAFACLHILSASKKDKAITVQLEDKPDHCQASNSGGGGTAYGAVTPPRLAY
ncbi:pilus assembly protein TadG-related protein [Cupriavidus necator]|uniref:pilus assembly protein TadG-related protein n=1 Tax=Cupriavidus necator TaxID=106590 RepID=UPI003077E0BE